HGDKAAIPLLERRIFHAFLGDRHPLPKGGEQVQFTQLEAQRRQGGMRRAPMLPGRWGKLFHRGNLRNRRRMLFPEVYPFSTPLLAPATRGVRPEGKLLNRSLGFRLGCSCSTPSYF